MGIEQWVPDAMKFPWKNEDPIERCQWKTGRSIPLHTVGELSSRKEQRKHTQSHENRNTPPSHTHTHCEQRASSSWTGATLQMGVGRLSSFREYTLGSQPSKHVLPSFNEQLLRCWTVSSPYQLLPSIRRDVKGSEKNMCIVLSNG